MGMIGVIIPMIGGILGLTIKMNKTVQETGKRLTGIELVLKEKRK